MHAGLRIFRLLLALRRAQRPADQRDDVAGRTDDVASRTKGLYDLAQRAFTDEQTRYDAAEVKTARYLTVLALVLGATAFKIDDLLWVMKSTRLRWYWEVPFVLAYAATFIQAFSAILLGVRAMSVEELGALPLDAQIPDLFES